MAEIVAVLDELDEVLNSAETWKTMDQVIAEQRKLFFEVIGQQDDGRLNAGFDRAEFAKFREGKRTVDGAPPKGKRAVEIYFDFEAYQDVSYSYCLDDDTIYVSRSYIGD